MFHIKLIARPDARMVEVPLEVEAELPREFDGAALLASSGLPRKVKIKAQRDTLKLSTAYRADQLVGDVVRSALKGTPQDVTRVTEAAAAFVRKVRERRPDGASLLVQSNGRGKIEVVESIPQPPGRTPAAGTPVQSPAQVQSAAAVQAAGGTLADRLNLVERRLAQLEARAEAGGAGAEGLQAVRAHAEATEQRLSQRLEKLEERLALALTQVTQVSQISQLVVAPREPQPLSASAAVAALPTPGSGRTPMRRATAVEAFAEGLRNELKGRAAALADAAAKASATLDKAELLALEARQSLGAAQGVSGDLRQQAQQAAARAQALRRVAEEADLYAPGELPVAGALLDRLGATAPEAALAGLRPLAEPLFSRSAEPAVAAWLSRAAPLCGWTVIAPAPGAPVNRALHEIDGSEESVSRLLAPGLLAADGVVLRRARVEARPATPEQLPELEPEPSTDSAPPPPLAAAAPPPEAPHVESGSEPEGEIVEGEPEEAPETPVAAALEAGPAPHEAAGPAEVPPADAPLVDAEPLAELEPVEEPSPTTAWPVAAAEPAAPPAAADSTPTSATPPAAAALLAADSSATVETAPLSLDQVAAAFMAGEPAAELLPEADLEPLEAEAADPSPPDPAAPPPRPFESALPPRPGDEGEPQTPASPAPEVAPPGAPQSEPAAAPPAAVDAAPAEPAPAPPAPLELHAGPASSLVSTPEETELALAVAVAAAVDTEVSGDEEWARIARGPEAFESLVEPAAVVSAAPPVAVAPPAAALEAEPNYQLGEQDVVAEEVFEVAPEDLLAASSLDLPALGLVPPAPPEHLEEPVAAGSDAGAQAPAAEVLALPVAQRP